MSDSDSASDTSEPDSSDNKYECWSILLFFHAIQENDKNTLRQLLEACKSYGLFLPADERDWRPLHIAASRPQYKECLELIFEYTDNVSVDINEQTTKGETALYIACQNGCEASVEILLQKGCDPYQKTSDNDSPLLAAVSRGHLKIVKSLLNYAENINEADWQGLTPLHQSALCGHFEICRVLLAKGADVHSKDRDKQSPLHLACQKGHFDIAYLLLKTDSTTINERDHNGITPLMLAVNNYNPEGVCILLENGAELDARDKNGRMALHFAASCGNVTLLRFLLQSTDASYIEPYMVDLRRTLEARRTLYSLACCAIDSENVECLEILASSKLSRSILQIPHIIDRGSVSSPLAYLFQTMSELGDEKLNACLQILLKHKMVMLDEFFEACPIKWALRRRTLIHPFSSIIFGWKRSFSQQLHYCNLLSANDITADYCLRCYHDNSRPFATFVNYDLYYEPVKEAILSNKIEIVKLMMSDSVILEPDEVCIRFNMYWPTRSEAVRMLKEFREIYLYLISLKPVYFTRFELRDLANKFNLPHYPCSIKEEFSQSTLKQLCRTVIRDNLRDYTLEDNLRNFKRKVAELPLPVSLKDYLLFKH